MKIQGISVAQLGPARRVGVLGGIAFVFWLLLLLPAYGIAGSKGLEGLTWAAVVCFHSGAPTVWIVSQVAASPERVWFVIAGMVIRMVAVAIVVLLFWKTRPDLGWAQFYCWLVIFYNLMLLVETYLVLPVVDNSNTRR